MRYTVKNLRDVADSAPGFGLQDIGEARFPREDLEAQNTGFALHTLRPGKRQAFAHRHTDAEEVYVVLGGGGRMLLDDEVVELRALDAVRVAPPVLRAFEAGSDGLELLVFGPRHAGDGELVTDVTWPER